MPVIYFTGCFLGTICFLSSLTPDMLKKVVVLILDICFYIIFSQRLDCFFFKAVGIHFNVLIQNQLDINNIKT